MKMWEKSRVLGAGTYGTVYLAHPSGSSDFSVAVKSADAPFAIESLEDEAEILHRLAGVANVVQCHGEDTSFEDGKVTYNLLLEYAPFGSLWDLIEESGAMSELTAACYTFMLLRGLDGMHSRGILHCDLKSANILVFPGECDVIKELKLADLGLAKNVSDDDSDNETPTWERCGQKYYNRCTVTEASPESCRDGNHGPYADVWSIGCIVYKMLTGDDLWHDVGCKQYIYDQILSDEPVEFPANLSGEAVSFLEKCLNREMRLRWSVKLLLEHPFIVKNLEIMCRTFGVDLMKQPKSSVQSEWTVENDLFSERMNDGQLERMMEQRPPESSYHHENAAMASRETLQLFV